VLLSNLIKGREQHPLTSKFSQFERKDFDFLASVVGASNVSVLEPELIISATDAFGGEWSKPDIVVWPDNTDQVSKILSYANQRRIPVTPRGAGSSLSGNVVPLYRGIVMSFRRMNRIIEVFDKDLQVRVEPGVVYDELNARLQPCGLFFPPDPGSSTVCTLGGMVANNASGLGAVHYGVTRDYVLGLKVVFPDGKVMSIGSRAAKSSSGYDLVGLFVGSEGTLGVITEITLKLKTLPRVRTTATAYFSSVSSATDAVRELMSRGLTPAALEFLDRETIVAINRAQNLGLVEEDALLLIEFHGTDGSAGSELKMALEICGTHGGCDIREAGDEEERKRLWAGRKAAYPSLLQSAPSAIIGDVVVPMSSITEMVASAYKIAADNHVRLACFGHLGDGNVHPTVLGDRRDEESWTRVAKTNSEIVEYAIKLGGVASGEHGIGIEKKQFMQLEHGDSLVLMKEIKRLMDPQNIMNPGKFFDV
jgi:glycolate oxidase subunit GlcD